MAVARCGQLPVIQSSAAHPAGFDDQIVQSPLRVNGSRNGTDFVKIGVTIVGEQMNDVGQIAEAAGIRASTRRDPRA
jgi:hypothetical protein